MEEPMCPVEYIAVKEEVREDIKCNLEDLHRSIHITTETPELDGREHYAIKKESEESVESNQEDVQSPIDIKEELGEEFTCTSQLTQHSVDLIAKLKNQLKVHLSGGTGVKPFLCEMSNYKDPKTASLSHLKVYSGDKPFACELCSYKCSIKKSMTRHIMITHTSEKPFLCKICDYKCSMKQYLKKHMKTHSSEKPYACAICLFKSAHKDALRNHSKVHTGKTRVCSIP